MSEEKSNSRKGGLGRGLNSLLGVPVGKPAETSLANDKEEKLLNVAIERVFPNPDQPRKIFVDDALKQLSQSILVDGIVQPLVVTKEGDNYRIIAGERRWRAAKMAGIKTLPVLVKEVTKAELLRLAIVENVQRADLNIIEEAEAYATLIKKLGLTQEECAQQVGKDRSTISNALRILNLPRKVKDELVNGTISMGHGRALLSLEDSAKILDVLKVIQKKGLSVRQTEMLIKKMKVEHDGTVEKEASADLNYLAESLRGHLKTKVKLVGSGTKGKIEISYFSPAELERLLELISNEKS